MWRTGLTALLLVALTGCDQVKVSGRGDLPGAELAEGVTDGSETGGIDGDSGSDDGSGTDGEIPGDASVVIDADELEALLEEARGFDAEPIEDRVEAFIRDVEATVPAAADPNLTGTWVWAWSRFGNIDAAAETAGDLLRFEDFGFEVVNITDDATGILELQYCSDRRVETLYYDANNNLLDTQNGVAVGLIVDSQRIDLGDKIEANVVTEVGATTTSTGEVSEYFFKLKSAPDSLIGRLTNTEPGGQPTELELSCITYWEQADVKAGISVDFNNFYMYRAPGCCAAEGTSDQLNNSPIRHEDHVITIELNSSRFSEPVVQVIEFTSDF